MEVNACKSRVGAMALAITILLQSPYAAAQPQPPDPEALRALYGKIADGHAWPEVRAELVALCASGHVREVHEAAEAFRKDHGEQPELLDRDAVLWELIARSRDHRRLIRRLQVECADLVALTRRLDQKAPASSPGGPSRETFLLASLDRIRRTLDAEDAATGAEEIEFDEDTGEMTVVRRERRIPGDGFPPTPDPGAVVDGELGALIDRRLSAIDADAGGLCGGILVARNGTVILNKGYGTADLAGRRSVTTDTLWDLASISKQFTAAAILELAEKRKLKITDRLPKFFDEVPADKRGITLMQLMSHTSGIPRGLDDHPGIEVFRDRERMARLLLGLPMQSRPGRTFLYSNMGYSLLAMVVEKASGRRFETYCVDELFRPAGMKGAGFIGQEGLDVTRVPRSPRGRGVRFSEGEIFDWAYKGSGGVLATLSDLLAWDRALRGDAILSASSRGAFFRPVLEDYALGWKVIRRAGQTYHMHTGSVGDTVTFFRRGEQSGTVIAMALGERPRFSLQELADVIEDLIVNW